MITKADHPPAGSPDRARVLPYLIFFASGFAGLAYEVAWTRQVGLLFGQTVHAAAVVLATYFAGMAAGTALGARWSGRVAPLRGYAVAEASVAAWAFVLPFLLELASWHPVARLLAADGEAARLAVRAVFAAVILFPATLGLGASLPFMAEHLARRGASGAKAASAAYALNIAGAVVGTVAASGVMLATAGVRATSWIAAALGLGCAAAAWALASRFPASSPAAEAASAASGHAFDAPPRYLYGLAVLAGFGGLALQVLYSRLFSLVLHNSVYSFGVVVAVYLVAMAAAAAWIARLATSATEDRALFAIAQSGGVLIAVSLLAFLWWTELEYFTAGSGFWTYLAGIALLVTVIVGPPVTVISALLPLTWNAASKGRGGGAVVGRLVAVNTLSAAVGAAFASFVFLPLLGLMASFITVAALYVALPLVLLKTQRSKANVLMTVGCVAFLGVGLKVAGDATGVAEGEEMLARWESAYGWIDVVKQGKRGRIQLRQNIHYGLGSNGSLTMERRQAHLPLLLHPGPKDVLFIGLATGVTSGAALDHGSVSRLDVVELIADVAKGSKFFAAENRKVGDDPRSHVVIDDGRNFLNATDRRYDVIVADLFVPWESHTGYLYTVEHYEVARQRLAPGGLFCQWLPLWQLGVPELRLIADSFASVFPVVTVWYGKIDEHWTALGLIGSEAPLTVDAASLERRLADVPAPLPGDHSWFGSPGDLLWNYAGDWPRPPAGEAAPLLNTDEHPRVEFSTPITAWTVGSRLRFDTLREFQAETLAKLETRGVVFTPSAASPPLDFAAVRAAHRDALKDTNP
jgi:spermidine synthase